MVSFAKLFFFQRKAGGVYEFSKVYAKKYGSDAGGKNADGSARKQPNHTGAFVFGIAE